MAEKRIDIIIGAQNQTGNGLGAARLDVDGFVRSMQQAGRGATEQFFEMAQLIGKARVAIDGAGIAAQLFRGDLEGAAESVKKLPLGIGAVAQSLQDVIEEILGLNEGLEELIEKGEIQDAQFNARMNAQARALSDVNAIIRESLDIAGRGDEAEALRHAERIKRLEEIARMTPALAQKAAEAEEAINAARFARELRRREEEALQREEIERQRARTIEELESEIREKSLEAQGKHLEAELERIRRSYERRINDAEDATTRELLKKRQLQDEDEARRRDRERSAIAAPPGPGSAEASRAGIGGVAVGGSFLGLQARFAGGEDPASDTARNTRRTNTLMEQLLKAMREALERPITIETRRVLS